MKPVKRLEVSFLRRGSLFDLNDLLTEELVEQYKAIYFDEMPSVDPKRPSPLFEVGLVERTGPDSFEIVPRGPYSPEEARQLGLTIDTQYLSRIARSAVERPVQPIVLDQTYENELAVEWSISGSELSRYYDHVPGLRPLRPNHRYVNINSVVNYVTCQLVKLFPRMRCYVDPQNLFDRLFSSKNLHQVMKPVLLLPRGVNADEQHPHVFTRINVKKLKSWLRRNQSAFYQSAPAHQRIVDELENMVAIRDENEQREMLENEIAQEQERLEAEPLVTLQSTMDDESPAAEEDEEDPVTTYLPATPSTPTE